MFGGFRRGEPLKQKYHASCHLSKFPGFSSWIAHGTFPQGPYGDIKKTSREFTAQVYSKKIVQGTNSRIDEPHSSFIHLKFLEFFHIAKERFNCPRNLKKRLKVILHSAFTKPILSKRYPTCKKSFCISFILFEVSIGYQLIKLIIIEIVVSKLVAIGSPPLSR
jgi:hypothetical protein